MCISSFIPCAFLQLLWGQMVIGACSLNLAFRLPAFKAHCRLLQNNIPWYIMNLTNVAVKSPQPCLITCFWFSHTIVFFCSSLRKHRTTVGPCVFALLASHLRFLLSGTPPQIFVRPRGIPNTLQDQLTRCLYSAASPDFFREKKLWCWNFFLAPFQAYPKATKWKVCCIMTYSDLCSNDIDSDLAMCSS